MNVDQIMSREDLRRGVKCRKSEKRWARGDRQGQK
jgi:hypothetical protein